MRLAREVSLINTGESIREGSNEFYCVFILLWDQAYPVGAGTYIIFGIYNEFVLVTFD